MRLAASSSPPRARSWCGAAWPRCSSSGPGSSPSCPGRENIYLNASLLGLVDARTIDKRFDEIVAFAELEQFIDNQVKYYSSGMYVRLGFAVAVNVDPDILVVDEVLAVGDEAFQRKCMARIKQFQDDGRTILFVHPLRGPGPPDLRLRRRPELRGHDQLRAARRGREELS